MKIIALTLLPLFALNVLALGDDEEPKGPVKLVVDPARAPQPKLRYRLLPPVAERESGNAANIYRRAFIPFNSMHMTDEAQEKRIDDWLAKPLEEYRKEKGKWGFSMLDLVDRAARMTHADWGVHREMIESTGTLDKGSRQTDDLPASRISKYLVLRSRAALAEGRPEDALRTYQTMLAMARHFSQLTGFPYQLTTIVLSSRAAKEVELFVQQPNAPNLYWAIRTLPAPLFDMRQGIELDLRATERDFELSPRVEKEILSDEDAQKLFEGFIEYLERVASLGHAKPQTDAQKAAGRLLQKIFLEENEKVLRRAGRSEGDIKKMSPAQVYLLAALYHHRFATDELAALLHLPYAEAMTKTGSLKAVWKEQGLKNPALIFTPIILGPSVNSVLGQLGKAERHWAMLATVEALRLHAAEKGGFPEKLGDCPVSIPNDPLTSQSFQYERHRDHVVLRSPAAPFVSPKSRADLVYEIRLRAK